MIVTLYKIVQVVIILLFGYFVSDLRKKNKTILILPKPLIIGMKIVYAIPMLIYLYIIVTLDSILTADVIAICLTGFGLIIVMQAKITLGKSHSWTGHGTFPDEFEDKGVYSYIRHPMYAGIFTCIFGMNLTIISHSPWWISLIVIFFSSYIILILYLSSQKETEHLLRIFGQPFANYVKNTPAFIPKKNKLFK